MIWETLIPDTCFRLRIVIDWCSVGIGNVALGMVILFAYFMCLKWEESSVYDLCKRLAFVLMYALLKSLVVFV